MIFLLFNLGCDSPEPNKDKLDPLLEELILLQKNPQTQDCNKLNPSLRQKCNQIKSRPHLWIKQPHLIAKKSTSGPISTHLIPKATALKQLQTSIKTIKAHNECHPQDWMCFTEQALNADNANEASALCGSIESSKWNDECYFEIAEHRLETQGDYLASAQLCSHSESFLSDCFRHLIFTLAKSAPHALSNEQDWQLFINNMNEHRASSKCFCVLELLPN